MSVWNEISYYFLHKLRLYIRVTTGETKSNLRESVTVIPRLLSEQPREDGYLHW